MLVVDVCDVCVMCVDMCTWFSGTPENVRRNTRTQACCTASHCKLERVGVLGNRGEVKDTCSGARVWHMMWTFCMTENFFFFKNFRFWKISEKFTLASGQTVDAIQCSEFTPLTGETCIKIYWYNIIVRYIGCIITSIRTTDQKN